MFWLITNVAWVCSPALAHVKVCSHHVRQISFTLVTSHSKTTELLLCQQEGLFGKLLSCYLYFNQCKKRFNIHKTNAASTTGNGEVILDNKVMCGHMSVHPHLCPVCLAGHPVLSTILAVWISLPFSTPCCKHQHRGWVDIRVLMKID